MDVSNTMAASTETSAASTVAQRLGRPPLGGSARGALASFADILQGSLQESAASLDRATRTSGEDTKGHAKGSSKKSDSTDASAPGAGTSPQPPPLSITALAATVPVPMPVQTPAPPLPANPKGNTSDEIDTTGTAGSATQPSSTLETAASARGNFRSNFARALSNASAQGAIAAAQNAQTSAADTANLADASPSSAAGNASASATDLRATYPNSSSPIEARGRQPMAAPAGATPSLANDASQANSTDSDGDKLIGENSAVEGAEIASQLPGAANSDSSVAPAAQTGTRSVSSASVSNGGEVDGGSVPSSAPVSSSVSSASTVSLDPPQTLVAGGIADTQSNSAAENSVPQAGTDQPAGSGTVSGSTTSGSSSGIAIPATSQATSETRADLLQTPGSKSANEVPIAGKSATEQTVNSASAFAHGGTQNGMLAASPIHNAQIAAEWKHSESTANSGKPVSTPPPASAASPVTQAQPAANSQNAPAQNPQPGTAAQVRQDAAPNAAENTQTNGALGVQLPSQFNPAPSTSKYDNKTDKVAAVSGSSETSGSSTPTTTATTTPTTITQVSDAGTFAKPTGPAASATQSHPPSANQSATQVLEDGPELSPAMHAWNGGENLQANLSGTPHLVQTLSRSEVNFAMQADALGAVQVRAHVIGDQVGAAITVEHHDAHAILSNDLPSLHQAFAEKQLRVENLLVQQGFFAGGGISDGRNGQQQSQQGMTQRAYPAVDPQPGFSSGSIFPTSADSSELRGSFDSQGRLSVRA